MENEKHLNFSDVQSLNNEKDNDILFVYPNFSDVQSLNNSKKIENKKSELNLIFSEFSLFSSNKKEIFDENKIIFSKGYLNFNDALNTLNDDNNVYDNIEPYIENVSSEGSWFDNSVPSRIELMQTYLIPLSNKINLFEFSYGFPIFSLDYECTINPVNKEYNNNLETTIFPKTLKDYSLNIESLMSFEKFDVTFQWELGNTGSYYYNLEFERTAGSIYNSNIEFLKNKIDIYNFSYEFIGSYLSFYNINFEIDSYISHRYDTNIEFFKGITGDFSNNIEFERILGTSYNNNLEFFSFHDFNFPMNIEFIKVYNDNMYLDLETERIYHEVYNFDLESSVFINNDYVVGNEFVITEVSKNMNLEFSRIYNDIKYIDNEINVSEINKDNYLNFETNVDKIYYYYPLDIQFNMTWNENYSNSYEYIVDFVSKSKYTDIETTIAAKNDLPLNLEFNRLREAKEIFQAYIIPFGYKDNLFQVSIFDKRYMLLGLEFDVPIISKLFEVDFETSIIINKDYNYNFEINIDEISKKYLTSIEADIGEINKKNTVSLEFIHVKNDNFNFNDEFNVISINKKYNIDLECNIPTLDKTYEIVFEYLQLMSYNIELNFENNIVINTSRYVDIEFALSELNKDYDITLESFITIDDERLLDLEFFMATVRERLDLEFDILDLVYYFVRQGFNIIPWVYSDGNGNWDNTVNRNWNKTSETTTINSGFINQLHDKGISIPSVINYADVGFANFGTIISGIQDKDIDLKGSFLYYENIDSEHTLVLGKKNKETSRIINLVQGENIIILDVSYSKTEPKTFKDTIYDDIKDSLISVQIWNQKEGLWNTTDDFELYFVEIIDGKEQAMPYIIKLEMTDSISVEFYR